MFGIKKDAETLSKIMEDCVGQDYKKVELGIHPVKVNVYDVYAKRSFIKDEVQKVKSQAIFCFADVGYKGGPVLAAYGITKEKDGWEVLDKNGTKTMTLDEIGWKLGDELNEVLNQNFTKDL